MYTAITDIREIGISEDLGEDRSDRTRSDRDTGKSYCIRKKSWHESKHTPTDHEEKTEYEEDFFHKQTK